MNLMADWFAGTVIKTLILAETLSLDRIIYKESSTIMASLFGQAATPAAGNNEVIDTNSAFFKVPLELRQAIYSLVFFDTMDYRPSTPPIFEPVIADDCHPGCSVDKFQSRSLGLFRVSRAISKEALAYFYSHVVVRISDQPYCWGFRTNRSERNHFGPCSLVEFGMRLSPLMMLNSRPLAHVRRLEIKLSRRRFIKEGGMAERPLDSSTSSGSHFVKKLLELFGATKDLEEVTFELPDDPYFKLGLFNCESITNELVKLHQQKGVSITNIADMIQEVEQLLLPDSKTGKLRNFKEMILPVTASDAGDQMQHYHDPQIAAVEAYQKKISLELERKKAASARIPGLRGYVEMKKAEMARAEAELAAAQKENDDAEARLNQLIGTE